MSTADSQINSNNSKVICDQELFSPDLEGAASLSLLSEAYTSRTIRKTAGATFDKTVLGNDYRKSAISSSLSREKGRNVILK